MDFKEQIDTMFMEIVAGITKANGVLTDEERKSLSELADICQDALTIDSSTQMLKRWEAAAEEYEKDKACMDA